MERGGGCFGARPDVGGVLAVEAAVWPLMVVDVAETSSWVWSSARVAGGGLLGEPAFQGLVERSTLPLVWG